MTGRRHLGFPITTGMLLLFTFGLSIITKVQKYVPPANCTEIILSHQQLWVAEKLSLGLATSAYGLKLHNSPYGATKRPSHRPDRPTLHLLILTLLISGDIETNPGPVRCPCGICNRAVASNHRAVCCDDCNSWIHIKCANISPEHYEHLKTSNCTWICFSCGIPNFSDSFFENSSIDISQNSFSTLSVSNCSDISSLHPSDSPATKSIRPGKPKKNGIKRHTLKILQLNCRSLRSNTKISQLTSIISTEDPDVVCGCETHLDSSIPTSEIFPNNYQIFRKDRSLGGGGVFIAVKLDIIASEEPSYSETDCEIIWVKLHFHTPPYTLAPSIDLQTMIQHP